eukprot:scaffold5817_cov101-Cylindrotheca_fusiformis.AAC.7
MKVDKVHPAVNPTTDTMMDPEEQGELELTEHDQLPDVEEYKASVGHRSKTSNGALSGSSSSRRPDPEGYESSYSATANDNFAMNSAEGDEIVQKDFHEIPRLGKFEKSQARLAWGSRSWKICGIVSFLLLVIVLLVLFLAGGDEEDFWHFLKGDTHSYREIKEYVTQVSKLTDPQSFDGKATPQYYAAQWLAHGDGLKVPVPRNNNVHYNERYAMAVLFFSLGGPGWTNKLNFLGPDHICAWYQEFKVINFEDEDLDQSSKVYGVHACRDDGTGELAPHAIYLSKSSIPPYAISPPCKINVLTFSPFTFSSFLAATNGLNGTIPSEIAGLVRLESLEIQSNPEVTGTLPEGLQSLTGLNRLMLQGCDIDGQIPSWISKMTGLRTLGLGGNGMTGTLPSDIGALDQLELLGLDGNQLYGNIDLFVTMTNLRSLYLDNNYFSGTLSEEWMDSLSRLEELDMSDNVLDGGIPEGFFNHDNELSLKVIDLHGNQLTGPFPSSIDENKVLEFLALHENKLDETIPDSLANLKALKHLDISLNEFTGNLPQTLYTMSKLEYLFVGENSFSAEPLSDFLIELSNLRELSMKNSQLTGSIPEAIFFYLKDLQFLDFHLNRLVGEIPTNIWLLSDLKYLLLKMNNLTGTLPETMNQLTNLEVLLLEQNNFIGDAGVICNEPDMSLEAFVSDCEDESAGIVCECCTACCKPGDAVCNTFDFNWRENLDPVWQYGYRRQRYSSKSYGRT